MRAWVGEGLAALLMGAKAEWNHNAFFDNIEDWMRKTDLYAANRQGYPRPPEETTTFDPFVDAFWALHRGDVPAQPDGADRSQMGRQPRRVTLKWVSTPRSWPTGSQPRAARWPLIGGAAPPRWPPVRMLAAELLESS